MINHRIANRWSLLFLSVITLLFPLVSFSQTYTSFVFGGWGDVLANDGFAYDPHAGSMYPPGQTIPMSQMMYATGACGNNNACTQLIGLGRQDGFAYLVGFWNTSNVYQAEGILPGQGTRFSQLAALPGWGNNGGFWSGSGGFTTVYTNNFLQVIGLGANDGHAYLAAFQTPDGTWHSAGILPGQTVPFSQLYVIAGNDGKLQVIGRAVSDNRLYVSAYQDDNGNWIAAGLLPGQTPTSSSVTVANGLPDALQVLSLGADGYIYLADWQDSSGTWHPSGILPGQSIPLENIVAVPEETGNGTVTGNWFWQLIVGGIGANDHIFHITDWQDYIGTWHVYDTSSVQIPQVPMAQAYAQGTYTAAGFYGIGQNDNHVYELAFDSDGTWSNGYDLTPPPPPPPPVVPTLSTNFTSVDSGDSFTLSWSVPTGSINHYTLSSSLNGAAATLTTVPAGTTSKLFTINAINTTKVFNYMIRACSSTDDSVCGSWSNTVQVTVFEESVCKTC